MAVLGLIVLNILKTSGLQFFGGGAAYCLLEILWRGYSHLTMFVAGGLVFCFLCGLSETDYNLPICALFGGVFTTVVELTFGLYFNVMLGMEIWDYSHEFLNFYGQICIFFSIIWCFLSAAVVFACRRLRAISESAVSSVSTE